MTRSQRTLAGTGFEKYTKATRRAQFLAEMDRVVPWRNLCARIEPVYPKPGNGRPPVGLEPFVSLLQIFGDGLPMREDVEEAGETLDRSQRGKLVPPSRHGSLPLRPTRVDGVGEAAVH